MKIAIYGGTFNPPHMGHVTAAAGASREIDPDLMLIMPAWLSPGKEVWAGDPDPKDRLEMCRLSFRNVPKATVSEIEILREERSYTAKTLQELRGKYPQDEMVLIVGSDMLQHLPKWREIGYILSQVSLAVLVRPMADLEKMQKEIGILTDSFGVKVQVLSHEPLGVSSTVVRELLEKGEDTDLMEPETLQFIKEKKLYQV